MKRIACLALAALTAGLFACAGGHKTIGRRVIVLGFDGLDYGLTGELMASGRLPNFSRLAERGSFTALGTSIPPQSPVAWSSFITGLDPGRHGIFDFVHRDPKTMQPYLSTTRTEPASRTLKFGKWQVPLESGEVELLREGQPFWDVLEQHGVETTIVRMPANFPPSGTSTRKLSGMGTPTFWHLRHLLVFHPSASVSTDRSLAGGAISILCRSSTVLSTARWGPEEPVSSST
jgi:hypothetical protein